MYAFVSIDADLYAPTAAALPLFWDRLSPGGVIMVHDYNSTQFPGVGKAVNVKTVSSILGHYSAGFTLDTYTHATEKMQKDAAQRMGSFIAQQAE